MGNRKRIALLLAQADEEYQKGFIEGVVKQAYKKNYDICIFSMLIKYQNNSEREVGDSNIYELINFSEFDAVILLADTIQTPGKIEYIEDKIRKQFDGPVICIDKTVEGFNCFYTDGYSAVYSLVSHLIEVHGYKDIAFLTGKKYHRHSQRRLDAYCDAMKNHHLEISEDRIAFGDFWYSSGSGYAETLLRNKGNMPDAVACANDCMAIGLAETLTQNGIRIPEDIAITGYGATEEAMTSPKPVTSAYIPSKYYGSYAVRLADSLLNGKKKPVMNVRPALFIGSSCGCNVTADTGLLKSVIRDSWATNDSEEGVYSIHDYMLDDLMIMTSLSDLVNTIYSNIYQIKNLKSYHLCLNKQWMMEERFNPAIMPVKGYADSIIHAIEYYVNNSSRNQVNLYNTFSVDQMLPGIGESPEPECYMFTPLFFEEKCFGYMVACYDEKEYGYSELFRVWNGKVSKGFECLRRELLLKSMQSSVNTEIMSKVTGEAADSVDTARVERLDPAEKKEMKEVERILDNNLLEYHFQPIVSAQTGEIVAYEALMRAQTEWKISPLSILKYAEITGRLSDVERLTFSNVLKKVALEKGLFGNRKIFINSIPGVYKESSDYTQNGELFKNASNIVVELTEQAELSDEGLNFIKDFLYQFNIEMAVDDYGTGYSNVSNLLRYMPNYVKIDRALLADINNSAQKRHFVRNIIEFCHENGILAIAEGVETPEELKTVIYLGADLIQGFYTARPSGIILDELSEDIKNEIKKLHTERQNNLGHQKFVAGKSKRVILNNLMKEGVDSVVVGDPKAIYRDITIVGTPGNKTGIHIEVMDNYEGRITIENVVLSNGKANPILKLGENCKVTLDMNGENFFENGGILVPESSAVEFEGDGNLSISINSSECYAIGNDLKSKHGNISFYNDGTIYINLSGNKCVGIGSGRGGNIMIEKGRYVITVNAEAAVGTGAFDADSELTIHSCDIETNLSVSSGVCIGSLSGDSITRVWGSAVKCYVSGKSIAAIGTIYGKSSDVDIHEASTIVNCRADNCTALGSMHGDTDFRYRMASLRLNINGEHVMSYGTPFAGEGDTRVLIYNSDININQTSNENRDCLADDKKIRIFNGRYQASINGEEFVRNIISGAPE